jgi:hypothetical protein
MHLRATKMALVAALSIGLTGTAFADTLQISQHVYDSYQEYLKNVGSNKPGAFAVSQSGQKSFYVYCENENCYLSALAKEALDTCQRDTNLPCTLLATNRDQKIEFALFKDTSAISSGDAVAKHVLGAADLKAKVVGSTLRGEYPNHVKWSEFYDQSGEIRGKDDDQGTYTARYTLDGNKLCYDYPGNDADWCATISLQGDDVQFLKGGELVNFTINSKLAPGNPDHL